MSVNLLPFLKVPKGDFCPRRRQLKKGSVRETFLNDLYYTDTHTNCCEIDGVFYTDQCAKIALDPAVSRLWPGSNRRSTGNSFRSLGSRPRVRFTAACDLSGQHADRTAGTTMVGRLNPCSPFSTILVGSFRFSCPLNDMCLIKPK